MGLIQKRQGHRRKGFLRGVEYSVRDVICVPFSASSRAQRRTEIHEAKLSLSQVFIRARNHVRCRFANCRVRIDDMATT